jgi:hypothetical protein
MNQRTMNESLGFLAHEIRNLINTSMLAVEALKRSGGVISGSTGAILDRSLRGMKDLCTRALVDVRLVERHVRSPPSSTAARVRPASQSRDRAPDNGLLVPSQNVAESYATVLISFFDARDGVVRS